MDAVSTTQLSVSVIDTEQAFRALADDWNQLTTRCNGAVFLRHEWFDAAWAWRRADAHLQIYVARQAGLLVGILPLVRVAQNEGFPRLRSLEFLTVPDTQTCDLITEPKNRSLVVQAICEALHNRRKEWDRLTLRYLHDTTSSLHELKAGFEKHRYTSAARIQGPNLFVNLGPTWDTYYGTRSRSLKKANNLAANRLKKAGPVTIQWITNDSVGDTSVDQALQQAIDISGRSWKQGTGNSLDQAGPKAFIGTLTKHAAKNGWLSLWLLSIDGTPLAMEYQLLDGENVYALRADFDAQHEEISPGSHLMRTLLETLFGRDLKRYYMGPGENAYKTRWTEDSDMLQQLVVHGNTWRGQTVRVVDDILRPAARQLRDRFAPAQSIVTPKDPAG